jgi:hypothetical protein
MQGYRRDFSQLQQQIYLVPAESYTDMFTILEVYVITKISIYSLQKTPDYHKERAGNAKPGQLSEL